MKKLLLLLGLVVVLLAGWLVSGPYLALRGLAGAIEQRDTSQLDRYVDFPMLRANLRAQLDDYVVRRAGPDVQSNLVGALLLTAGQKLSGTAVDAMVTPTGIGALMEGHTLWKRASNDLESNDAYAAPRAARPLEGATHRFESTSRFTATTHTAQGAPVVFVLQRQGLRWKLVNIELPLD
ncbi:MULTISPECIES: DUF2939 domain-containing protein [Stenotrophomonas]|uniref:DUF2939 domain-containing protein n=1 Tax=Stenotrophomonas sp. CFBP8994 TaxID=3096527 RepID=UPI002A6A104F|nr:DUF2939 domain-containing protein [Stenotrophomonas sp. CFBP8994]MDY0978726.1 DUF2939 domain-containing protein [Stenotrophomonas sp. CFBP8994]